MAKKCNRILVTGSTGFVGRHLVRRLLTSDFELVLPVRNTERCPIAFRTSPRVQLIPCDGWGRSAKEALRGVSGVVHLAGLAHVRNPRAAALFEDANVRLTSSLVDEVKKAENVSLFVHMSSLAAITGNASDKTVDDYTPARPTTDYGLSKLRAEACVAELSNHGVAAISLRPPLIVGSGAKGNWALLLKLATTGVPLPFGSVHNRRSLVSVQTVAEAIDHLCSTKPSPATSGSYCLTDSEPLSLKNMLSELRAGVGMRPRLLPVPVPVLAALGHLSGARRVAASLLDDLYVDASRFDSVFGFQSSVYLRAEIRGSAAEYRQARRSGVRLERQGISP